MPPAGRTRERSREGGCGRPRAKMERPHVAGEEAGAGQRCDSGRAPHCPWAQARVSSVLKQSKAAAFVKMKLGNKICLDSGSRGGPARPQRPRSERPLPVALKQQRLHGGVCHHRTHVTGFLGSSPRVSKTQSRSRRQHDQLPPGQRPESTRKAAGGLGRLPAGGGSQLRWHLRRKVRHRPAEGSG